MVQELGGAQALGAEGAFVLGMVGIAFDLDDAAILDMGQDAAVTVAALAHSPYHAQAPTAGVIVPSSPVAHHPGSLFLPRMAGPCTTAGGRPPVRPAVLLLLFRGLAYVFDMVLHGASRPLGVAALQGFQQLTVPGGQVLGIEG
jgi:hypothetical protein